MTQAALSEDAVLELLKGLVAVPSVNPALASDESQGEAAIADYAQGWLEDRGVDACLEEAASERPNVVAEIGDGAGPTLILCGHLDTVSPDGMTILVGRRAEDNDLLSLKLGRPYDFWLHVAAGSGSHVVVLNPDRLARLPRQTQALAAGLAAGYSKVRDGGQVAVHLATVGDVGKPRGAAPGKVSLRRSSTVKARPIRDDEELS